MKKDSKFYNRLKNIFVYGGSISAIAIMTVGISLIGVMPLVAIATIIFGAGLGIASFYGHHIAEVYENGCKAQENSLNTNYDVKEFENEKTNNAEIIIDKNANNSLSKDNEDEKQL